MVSQETDRDLLKALYMEGESQRIHLDDATAAILRQNADHTLAK